jgi:hypothetical protein
MPVIDETGITQNIDITLPPGSDSMKLNELKSFLECHGFTVYEANRLIPVTVISNDQNKKL